MDRTGKQAIALQDRGRDHSKRFVNRHQSRVEQALRAGLEKRKELTPEGVAGTPALALQDQVDTLKSVSRTPEGHSYYRKKGKNYALYKRHESGLFVRCNASSYLMPEFFRLINPTPKGSVRHTQSF